MTYRPYPNPVRARHQLDRHDDETGPYREPRPMTPMERTLIEGAKAMVKAAAPGLVKMAEGFRRPPIRYVVGLGRDVGDVRAMTEDEVATLRQKYERPVGGEETNR